MVALPKALPSKVTSPAAIAAMPATSIGANLSPRKIAPRRIALAGTISVTSEALVAPAFATRLK